MAYETALHSSGGEAEEVFLGSQGHRGTNVAVKVILIGSVDSH